MSKEVTDLTKTDAKKPGAPAFVEAEKMFDKLAEITRETAAKAYDFFVERGTQFGSHFEDWLRAESATLRTAPVKITHSDGIINVMVATPGFTADEIEVSIKDDLLIVSGETRKEETNTDESTFYTEWQSNRFLRKLVLPAKVDVQDVDAKLKDGILRLTLRKAAEVEAAKVAVQSA